VESSFQPSRYVYGTTRLGDESLPFEERVRVASEAIGAGLWIHTSHQYGDALRVLSTAIHGKNAGVPSAFFKIGWDSVDQIREQIRHQLDAIGLERMTVGQLCLGGKLVDALRMGGPEIDGLLSLKDEGLVDRFVLEVWPWNSEAPLAALEAGHADRLLDGYIFYLNPLQRFVSNALWDAMRDRQVPIVAMRTVAGGSVQRLRESADAPDYLRERATQVAPIYDRSGCETWTEFCVRFALGNPQVKATVGATARSVNLREFTEAAKAPQPLPEEIVAELERLQRGWADAHDAQAAPWSM